MENFATIVSKCDTKLRSFRLQQITPKEYFFFSFYTLQTESQDVKPIKKKKNLKVAMMKKLKLLRFPSF